jgi:hypothetical protein
VGLSAAMLLACSFPFTIRVIRFSHSSDPITVDTIWIAIRVIRFSHSSDPITTPSSYNLRDVGLSAAMLLACSFHSRSLTRLRLKHSRGARLLLIIIGRDRCYLTISGVSCRPYDLGCWLCILPRAFAPARSSSQLFLIFGNKTTTDCNHDNKQRTKADYASP